MKTIIYNKDWSIATYEQVCARMEYAEEELECIEAYMNANNYPIEFLTNPTDIFPNSNIEPIYEEYSYIWRIASNILNIKSKIKWDLQSYVNNKRIEKNNYTADELLNHMEQFMYFMRNKIDE